MTILIKRTEVDDVLLGHVGLPRVLPVIVHLKFFMLDGLSGSFYVSFTLWVFVWDPIFLVKSYGVVSWLVGSGQVRSVNPSLFEF